MTPRDSGEPTVKGYDLNEDMRPRIDQLADWLMEAETKLPCDFLARFSLHGQEHDEFCTTIASLLRGLLGAPPTGLSAVITIGVFLNMPPSEQHAVVRPFIQPTSPEPAVKRLGEVQL